MRIVPNTIYNILLSDGVPTENFFDKEKATRLFDFFKQHPLFRWQDANNDCEDRANAICLLLDEWGLPNYKGWVFGSNFLSKENGYLINNWKYHVAAIIPVKDEEQINFYVIDPATLRSIDTILEWATSITDIPFSHYVIKWGYYYIFPEGNIQRDNWHKRNRQNYKWTIQGLAGINGVMKTGRAEIIFNKNRIKNTEKRFGELLKNKPLFLEDSKSL
jgi:hypothetical protein